MTTGLWAAISGMPAAAVVAAIPPACRRTLDDATAWTDGDDAIIEAPVWPAAGATHFVPAFSALTPEPFSVRHELSVRVGAAWSPWVAGVGLGPAPFAPLPDAPPLRVDVDVFRAAAPVEAVRLRARLLPARRRDGARLLAAPGGPRRARRRDVPRRHRSLRRVARRGDGRRSPRHRRLSSALPRLGRRRVVSRAGPAGHRLHPLCGRRARRRGHRRHERASRRAHGPRRRRCPRERSRRPERRRRPAPLPHHRPRTRVARAHRRRLRTLPTPP